MYSQNRGRFIAEMSVANRHCGKRDIYRHVVDQSSFVVTFKTHHSTGPFKLVWQCGSGKEKFVHGVPSVIRKKNRKNWSTLEGISSEKDFFDRNVTSYAKITDADWFVAILDTRGDTDSVLLNGIILRNA